VVSEVWLPVAQPAPPFNQEAVAADPAYLKANSAQFGLKLALPIPYRSAEDSL